MSWLSNPAVRRDPWETGWFALSIHARMFDPHTFESASGAGEFHHPGPPSSAGAPPQRRRNWAPSKVVTDPRASFLWQVNSNRPPKPVSTNDVLGNPTAVLAGECAPHASPGLGPVPPPGPGVPTLTAAPTARESPGCWQGAHSPGRKSRSSPLPAPPWELGQVSSVRGWGGGGRGMADIPVASPARGCGHTVSQ